ncbi:MAG: CsgG/HfaB family protein [Gammaproteobacteria bacterium]|nr:CsgG/HfaB family protein [Gammaproteobacteria bacterium]
MKKQLTYKLTLLAVVSVGFVILGCGPNYRTIYQTFKSTPAGAKIYYGSDRNNISNYKCTTPCSDSYTSTYPAWSANYYKAVKRGYQPSIQHQTYTTSNMSLTFDLEKLPRFPTPPKVRYPDPDTVAITKPLLDANKHAGLRLSKKQTIAIINFKEPANSGAGSLMADSMILELKNRNFKVVDRDQIEKLMREHGLMAGGKTKMTDLEISKKLGKLVQADYIIYGAITEYSAKSENISLSPVIHDSDLRRYDEEYRAFVDFYRDNQDVERMPTMPKSIQEWELDYASKAKQSYITIARVGVTAKMVDMKSSNIVYVGIANVTDKRLQQGVRRIVNAMTEDILTN